jgi:hypothetical protein
VYALMVIVRSYFIAWVVSFLAEWISTTW